MTLYIKIAKQNSVLHNVIYTSKSCSLKECKLVVHSFGQVARNRLLWFMILLNRLAPCVSSTIVGRLRLVVRRTASRLCTFLIVVSRSRLVLRRTASRWHTSLVIVGRLSLVLRRTTRLCTSLITFGRLSLVLRRTTRLCTSLIIVGRLRLVVRRIASRLCTSLIVPGRMRLILSRTVNMLCTSLVIVGGMSLVARRIACRRCTCLITDGRGRLRLVVKRIVSRLLLRKYLQPLARRRECLRLMVHRRTLMLRMSLYIIRHERGRDKGLRDFFICWRLLWS